MPLHNVAQEEGCGCMGTVEISTFAHVSNNSLIDCKKMHNTTLPLILLYAGCLAVCLWQFM